jgi:cytochrome c oxidase accessory protein FixG
MTAYVFAALLTFTTYALAGTMREQVCTYMCPWPRIQGALIDKDTLAVTYRSERGDPRGAHKKGETWEGRGDCIDCRQCVTACPMGIDIRNGPQLECIHCALCIDACDAIMTKIGRPTGLIAYDTDENVIRRWMKQSAAPFKALRPRTMLYATVFAITGAIMIYGLSTRTSLELSALKDRSLPFVQLASGDIRNAYTLKVVNKSHAPRSLNLSIDGVENARIEIIGDGAGSGEGAGHVTAGPDSVDRYRLLVTAPRSSASGNTSIRLVLLDGETAAASTTTHFVAPEH